MLKTFTVNEALKGKEITRDVNLSLSCQNIISLFTGDNLISRDAK